MISQRVGRMPIGNEVQVLITAWFNLAQSPFTWASVNYSLWILLVLLVYYYSLACQWYVIPMHKNDTGILNYFIVFTFMWMFAKISSTEFLSSLGYRVKVNFTRVSALIIFRNKVHVSSSPSSRGLTWKYFEQLMSYLKALR